MSATADPVTAHDFEKTRVVGGFDVEYSDIGEPLVARSHADSSLIFFFLRLLHRLQKTATVPAIDYVEYSRLVVVGKDVAAASALGIAVHLT
ncbi:MAG: hypothetical protein ACREOG_07570 [Gemmatimonadaceae bacterium]